MTKKGFSGRTCRDDIRFIEANAVILIIVLIVFVLISMPICIGLICRYKKKTAKNNNKHTLDENNLPSSNNSESQQTHKKKIYREVSSVSENLGNIIEKKNSVYYNERVKNLNEIKELLQS